MGFTSFWMTLVDRRVKEITPHRRFSFEQQEQPAVGLNEQQGSVTLSEPVEYRDKRERRKSRTFSLSNPSSEEKRVKRRRSWWGGTPAAEDAPAVPALPALAQTIASSGGDVVRPSTAVTGHLSTEDWQIPATPASEVEMERSRRLSLGNVLKSRKRSQPTLAKKIERRQSVLGGHREVAALPVLAAAVAPIPIPAEEDNNHLSAAWPVTSQRSRSTASVSSRASRTSRVSKISGTDKSNRSRSLRPRSGNDDDSARFENSQLRSSMSMPALPALVNDGSMTPERSSPEESDDVDALFGSAPVRVARRGNCINAPRPVSGLSLTSQRKAPIIRGTDSTSGRRASYWHSLLDDGEGGMMCLSDEQQREWEKLKELMNVMDKRADAGVIGMLRELEEDEHTQDQSVFSNFSNQPAWAEVEFHDVR